MIFDYALKGFSEEEDGRLAWERNVPRSHNSVQNNLQLQNFNSGEGKTCDKSGKYNCN